MRKLPRKKAISAPPADPVTAYALAVQAGDVIAGPHVRNACARHLRDIEHGHERGLLWRPDMAVRTIGYFRDVLRLTGGQHERKPFVLRDWQEFVEGSLFGWVREDGARRFVTAFILTGKGSGKTPVAAGTAQLMATADGEARAECYIAATDKEQAGVAFRDCVAQTKLSPALLSRATLAGGDGREFNIAYLETGSFIRPISSESQGRGKSGYRPHCVVLDEIHEHPTNAMVEFMRAGTKNRRQPLIFMITNAGFDRSSVCFEYQQYAEKVAAGTLEDDSFFSYVCAIDEDEDPFTDPDDPVLGYPRSWAKTNPTLEVTPGIRYLRDQVTAARGMPSKESTVRRLNFCQWVDAANPWIDSDLWRACQIDTIEEPEAGTWWLSLDLSQRRDLTAAGAVRRSEDGKMHARTKFWTPADTIEERSRKERVPYNVWAQEGKLEAVPGRSIDYDYVAQWVAEFCGSHNVAGLVFDRWRIEDFLKSCDNIGFEAYIWEGPAEFEGHGLKLVPHGQGFTDGAQAEHMLWMPRSITDLETAVLNGNITIEESPVLNYCSASAVQAQDASGNKKWEKRKSTGRIDGIVALCMAVGAAVLFGSLETAEPSIRFL